MNKVVLLFDAANLSNYARECMNGSQAPGSGIFVEAAIC